MRGFWGVRLGCSFSGGYGRGVFNIFQWGRGAALRSLGLVIDFVCSIRAGPRTGSWCFTGS